MSVSSKISQRLMQVAFDGQKLDHSPLGVEALWRGSVRRNGDDRSVTAEPMHGLDVDPDVRHKVPRGADVRSLITRVDRYEQPMVDDDVIGCRW